MKNFKKIMSVIVSVVMIISTFSTFAFALNASGAEDANKINVKFSVEQVDLVSPNGEDIGAVDNNLYAVTLSMKAQYGVMYLQTPIHYNKEHFDVIMDGNYEGNGNGTDTAILGYDGFYTDNTYGSIYTYSLPGQTFTDTTMTRANGATTTNATQAVYIGNGRENRTMAIQVEAVDSTFEIAGENVYGKWIQGLDSNKTGVVFVCFDCTTTKTPWLNVFQKTINTDWDDIVTIYFQRKAGVSAADCAGDVFGIDPTSTFASNFMTGWDEAGSTYATTASVGNQTSSGLNLVSNAVVEAAADPVLTISHARNQIRFNTNADSTYANSFDYRIISKIDNFDEVFASVEDGRARIKDIGFVFSTAETVDLAAAKAQVEGGAVTYSQVTKCHLSTTGTYADYAFTCLVKNIADNEVNKAATLSAVGYVIYENAAGETAYAYYEASLDVGALYSANSGYIPA